MLLPDGRELTVRRAGSGDLPAVREMHRRCSPRSRYQRYLAATDGPADGLLARLLDPDPGGALLAEVPDTGQPGTGQPGTGQPGTGQVVGLVTLVGEGVQAELGLLVEDAWQRHRIGTALLRRAIALATGTGFDAVVVHARACNPALHRMLRRLDLTGHTERDGTLLTVTVPLDRTPARLTG